MSNIKHFNFKKIIFATLIYTVILFIYGYYTYSSKEAQTLKEVKRELLHGAMSVPLLLDKNYHDRDFEKDRVTKEEDLNNIIKLSRFIKNTNLTYIYSFVQENNHTIVFSSSSATKKELQEKKEDLYSFDPYSDKNLIYLFNKGKIGEKIYTDTVDKWGHFLSVYILLQTEKGKKYIVGADYKQQDLSSLRHAILNNIIYVVSFIIILMVLLYMLSNYSMLKFLKNELKRKTKELKTAYELDKHTGLKNKTKLLVDLKNASKDSLIALIDIENFSMLNDVYGYKYGDKYLLFVSSLLKNHCHKHKKYKLYKLDSDLFCILNETEKNPEKFQQDIYKILLEVGKKKFQYQEYESSLSLRVGIADITREDNPLIHAETALKAAKENRRHTMIYLPSMDYNSQNKQILDTIHYAIENNKVHAYFQPIYDLKTQTITKYEALMRIETQENKITPPAYFLTLAKKTLFYKELTNIMIAHIIQVAKSHPNKNFSLNLSSIDIENKELTQGLLKRIEDANIGRQIGFEILESEEFKDFELLKIFIRDAKELGISISIDDFGSGYSNIANTIRLDIDYLKIDGSLITNVLHNPRYEQILKSIIKFAHDIGALTIAEFVENKEIAQKMVELEVDMIQGYYVGRPSPVICEEE
jgi:EAL domain-containing protein (putative c-di-GMP-specific phosphodiesterase class I)/GGDEF domain-containing protein